MLCRQAMGDNLRVLVPLHRNKDTALKKKINLSGITRHNKCCYKSTCFLLNKRPNDFTSLKSIAMWTSFKVSTFSRDHIQKKHSICILSRDHQQFNYCSWFGFNFLTVKYSHAVCGWHRNITSIHFIPYASTHGAVSICRKNSAWFRD